MNLYSHATKFREEYIGQTPRYTTLSNGMRVSFKAEGLMLIREP